jgi:sec-independent protein translocase protein TatA
MDLTTPVLAALFGLGTPELIGIGLLIMLLFGAKRLPDLARSMGKSIREFKKGAKEIEADLDAEADAEPPAANNGAAKPVASANTNAKE